MTRTTRKYPGAAIAAGAIGGLLGAWFKLGWEVTWPPRAPDRIPEPMVLVTMFTHVPTPVWASLVIHFTFSILSGIAYGALVEFFPIVAIGAGDHQHGELALLEVVAAPGEIRPDRSRLHCRH